MNPTMNEQVTE